MNKQVEANNRYLANNPEARKKKSINNMKSNGKKFILEYATFEDIELYRSFLNQREDFLNKEKR